MRRSVESRRNDSKSWVFFRPAPAPRPPAPPRDGGARRDGGAPTPAYLDDSDSLEDGGAGWHAQQMEAETQRKEALARMGMGSLAENSGGQSAVVRLRPPRPAPPYPASLPPAAEGCAAQIRSPFSGVPNNSRGVGAPRGAPNPPRIQARVPGRLIAHHGTRAALALAARPEPGHLAGTGQLDRRRGFVPKPGHWRHNSRLSGHLVR